jgi:hypothetical protein
MTSKIRGVGEMRCNRARSRLRCTRILTGVFRRDVQYEKPEVIIQKIETLENEIQKSLKDLKVLLKYFFSKYVKL